MSPPVSSSHWNADRPDDLRERERQHREIDAREPHAEPAEQHAAEPAASSGASSRPTPIGRPQPLDRSAARIGAEAEIGGVAERGHAARPHDEMQAGGEQGEDRSSVSTASA